MAGVFRLLNEVAVIAAPMVLREIILFVDGKATVVPNTLAGGLGLAALLLALVLVKASMLQHFIHGGNKRAFFSSLWRILSPNVLPYSSLWRKHPYLGI